MPSSKETKPISKKGTSHESQLKQLNRIAGQVKGISKMIEEKRYCTEILTQIKAVKSSMSSVEKKIINEHLNHCVHKALLSKEKSKTDSAMEEIKDLLSSVRL